MKEITYRKVNDYNIPNLILPKDGFTNYNIGKYGYLRLDYLKNNKKGEYELMKIKCTLRNHIVEIDLQANKKVKLLINQFKENENGKTIKCSCYRNYNRLDFKQISL